MPGADEIFVVVGRAEVPWEEEDVLEELTEYQKLAQNHPGCMVASLAKDVAAPQVYRIHQEWNQKASYLAFHRTVAPPRAAVLNHYEATPFAAPGLQKEPHHVWAKAERKDLTKGQGKLFFLSSAGRTKHALFNNTPDLQYDIAMRFPQQDMKPAPGTTVAGEQFKVTVFPGQTTPFIEGKWNGGYALSYSYGPVTDTRYLDESAKTLQSKVQKEAEVFKEFLASNGLNVDQPGILDLEDFEERALALAVERHTKYVDLKWCPVQSSISRSWEGKRRVLAWMRPEDYLPAAYKDKVEHIVKTIEPADIDQGALGDCWFLAAVASCAEWPEQLIVPIFRDATKLRRDAASYNEQHRAEVAAGAFRVRLAKHGWWKWHIVDTYLPVQPLNEPGGPCFARNKQEPNELWVALLEKCYAKLHGSYVAISGGDPAVALADLTGFPTVSFDWKEANDALFKRMVQHDEHGRLLWVSTPGEDASDYMGGSASEAAKAKAQKYDAVGLGTGHAYTVLKVALVDIERDGKKRTIRILQIRNPWGNDVEWNRAWSDNSKEWREYPEVMEYIKHKWDIATPEQMFQKDGSYWMAWNDCLQYFNGGGVCLRHNNWQDVRLKTSFTDGSPEHVFKITPNINCQAVIFGVQHDRRGLPRDDPRKELCALRVEVVTASAKKPTFDTLAQSNDGVFMYANQVVAFPPGKASESPVMLEAGKDYYVILRQHPGEQKQAVRNRDEIVLTIQSSPGARNQHLRGISPLTTTAAVPFYFLSCSHWMGTTGQQWD
ncbi:Calpain-B [Diplonema papillatum]|nr:Calpain-B [Diplonema papillatum]